MPPEAVIEAPKPNGAAKAPPPAVDPDEAPLKPLDPMADVGDQIKRAQEVVSRAERKAQKAAAKADKGKPKAKAKATEAPAPAEEEAPTTEPAPPIEEEADEPALEQPSAAMLVKARQLAEKGDLDAAIKLAFGKPAEAFKLNSARWAEWRKTNDQARKATAEREERVRDATEKLAQKYGPLVEARKLFEAEDYEGAFQKAFGLDLNSFQKKALSKYHGKNPEVEALRKELRERDEREQKREQEARQREQQQQEAQLHRSNMQAITTNLGQSNDEQLAALAKRPNFIRQVYREFLHEVKQGADENLLTVVACAEKVRDGILGEFGDLFVPRDLSASGRPHPGGTNPESPHQAGKKPARPGAASAAPTSLSQRGASEASPPGKPLTEEELFRKYTDQMRRAD